MLPVLPSARAAARSFLTLSLLVCAAAAAEEPPSTAATADLAGDLPTLAAVRASYQAGDFLQTVLRAPALVSRGEDTSELRGYWATALVRLGQLDSARTVAAEGRAKFPDDALSQLTMARVHLAFAEFNDAGQALYDAVKREPTLAAAHLELARLYEAERRMATAKRHYRIAFELHPTDPATVLAWSRTVTDPAYQLSLLQKYLELVGSSDDDDSTVAVASTIDVLRKIGDGGRCTLRGGPRQTALKLQHIRPGPGDPNRFALKISVNGKSELRTLVDTGASGVIVSESYARGAGLESLGRTWILGLGKEGRREGYFARARTLAAQDLVYEDCVVEVVPDEVFENHTTQAVMGLDGLYRDFVITFDFTRSQLGLSPLPALPGAAEGRPDTFSYDRDVSALPPGFYPARVFGKDFLVPVLLNESQQAYFLIDSGASTTVIAKRAAQDAGGVRPSNLQMYGLSGQIEEVWTAPPLVLNVLGLAQRYQGMVAIDLDRHAARSGIGIDGLLGYSFLEHSVLTLDDRNGLVSVDLGRVVRRPSR